jgi:hypothetical protein
LSAATVGAVGFCLWGCPRKGVVRRNTVAGMPHVALRILTSLVVGCGAFVLSSWTGQSSAEGTLLSVLIGGVVFVVQYLVEFERRISGLTHAKIVFELIEASPLDIDDVELLSRT